MKFKFLLSLCVASAALSAVAQTHQEGVEYYRADQFGNARELLERNMNNPGTDKAIAHYYLGLLDTRNEDYADAQKHFEAGIAANPNNPYNYVGLGGIDLRKGNVKAAEANFKLAEKHSKKDAALQVAIARAYYKSGKNASTLYAKQIEKYLEKARKINMTEPEIFIFEGDRAYDNNDANNAGSNYEMATTYNPQSADAYVKYANLFRKINPDYSIKMLQALLKNNPSSALGQRELAKIYYDLQQYDKAAEQYGKYVENPSHFKQDEDMYSLMLFFKGDYQKGYDYATKLLKENPKNFTARLYQFRNGMQLDSMKDQWTDMADNIWKYHMEAPDATGLAQIDYNLMLDQMRTAKEYDKALQVVAKAQKDFPNVASFLRSEAMLYSDQNDFAKAAEAYTKYIDKNAKPSAVDYLQAALFYYNAGAVDKSGDTAAVNANYRKAIEFADKSVAADPNYYQAYLTKADALNNLDPKGNLDQVRGLYQQAVSAIENAGITDRNQATYEQLKKAIGK